MPLEVGTAGQRFSRVYRRSIRADVLAVCVGTIERRQQTPPSSRCGKPSLGVKMSELFEDEKRIEDNFKRTAS